MALLTSVAESGNGFAAHNLGTIYVTGMPGIEPDKQRSIFYYRLARDLGLKLLPEEFYR